MVITSLVGDFLTLFPMASSNLTPWSQLENPAPQSSDVPWSKDDLWDYHGDIYIYMYIYMVSGPSGAYMFICSDVYFAFNHYIQRLGEYKNIVKYR